VIFDGAPGREAALVALWGDDYRAMIQADTAAEVEKRRKAFLRKWRLKRRAVADCLEDVKERPFTFTGCDRQRKPRLDHAPARQKLGVS